jgi:hypothetical protein
MKDDHPVICQQILDECRARGVTPLTPIIKWRESPRPLSWLFSLFFAVNAITVRPATPRQTIEFLSVVRFVAGESSNYWASTVVGQYRWWTVRLLD